MRLFLDTANIDEIRTAARWGVLAGVTTNPSLYARESASGVSYRDRILEIAQVVNGPISAECVSTSAEALVAEARNLAAWHPNVVVKIPITPDGLEAISRVSRDGIRVNVTLIFSVNQALLAAQAGAAYVSPFLGRLDDIGNDGVGVVREVVELLDRYHLPTQVIAASIRTPQHVAQVAAVGAHIATVPFKVLEQMIQHPLTDAGIERFLADWKQAQSRTVGTDR